MTKMIEEKRQLDLGDRVIEERIVEFQNEVKFLQLPETPIEEVPASSATPSVLNNTKILLSSSSPVNITNFLNGQEGQTIFVVGDGNSTVVNNSTVLTNTGADKLLSDGGVYCFTLVSGQWKELSVDVPTSGNNTCIPLVRNGPLHTHSSVSVENYPNNVETYIILCSLLDFTEVRLFGSYADFSGSGTTQISVQYSLNGTGGWASFISSSSFSATSVDTKETTAYTSIPAPARVDTVYLRVRVIAPITGEVSIRSLNIQVK